MAAREDYASKGYEVEYVNVMASRENMARMLEVDSRRKVPTMVIDGKVTVGHGGT